MYSNFHYKQFTEWKASMRILCLTQRCSKTTGSLINPSLLLFFLLSPFLCIRNIFSGMATYLILFQLIFPLQLQALMPYYNTNE